MMALALLFIARKAKAFVDAKAWWVPRSPDVNIGLPSRRRGSTTPTLLIRGIPQKTPNQLKSLPCTWQAKEPTVILNPETLPPRWRNEGSSLPRISSLLSGDRPTG